MKAPGRIWLAALVALAAAPGHAAAQGGGTPGRGPGAMMGGGNYDVKTEATLSGTVSEVRQMPAPGRGPGGVHVVLESGGETVEVHLGPASFLQSKKIEFAAGDAVTVTGSRVTMMGRPALLAREITRGGTTVVLRNERGIPLWSGRMRGEVQQEGGDDAGR